MEKFLHLNGISSSIHIDNEDIIYFRYNGMFWFFNGDQSEEIDGYCSQIYDAFIKKIFNSWEIFNEILSGYDYNLCRTGVDSESFYDKDLFTQKIQDIGTKDKNVYKVLYYMDCSSLILSIQECVFEIRNILEEFYFLLNEETMFDYRNMDVPDGARISTSPVVNKLHAYITFIFIRLRSLLDYVAKLFVEYNSIPTEFNNYITLKSTNKTYKHAQSFCKSEGSLFTRDQWISLIEDTRDRLVHNSFLDRDPKGYEIFKSGKIIEKFILFPDFNDQGHFITFKNRRSFYSQENKINFILPYLVKEMQKRLIVTLKNLCPLRTVT